MLEFSFHKKLNAAAGKMNLQVNGQINKGQLITLYGKSGVGKTSILRILAGLMQPEKGQIKVENQTWLDTDKKINWSPQKRKIGFVFQDYALFPNMTVKENLLFALEKKADKKSIDELIEIIELGDLQKRKPTTLSGGQKQRVALARSLVQRPQLLLLDEPLSALDHEMRIKLQQYILQAHQAFNLTTILVSHDIAEIVKMSDQVFVLENGTFTNKGAPIDIFTNKEVSGKFQFTGEIIDIKKQDFIFIVSIIIGKEMVRIVADENEGDHLKIGDKVLVASKAFNPIIKKIE